MVKTPDPEFNAAVRRFCNTLFPVGFDCVPDAPDTFSDLAATFTQTGRMVITDKWVPEDHPAFEDAHTYRSFRAWHDWVHLLGGFQFTLAGECGAAKFQKAELAALYGQDKADKWFSTLTDELVLNNFGECAVCEVAE